MLGSGVGDSVRNNSVILEGNHGDTVQIACSALKQAADIGDVNFVRWLLTQFKIKNAAAVGEAITTANDRGHFAVVDMLLVYVQSSGLSYDRSEAMFAAAKSGKLEMVQWLFTRHPLKRSSDLFLEQQRGKTSDGSTATPALDVAAEYGHLEVLAFLQTVDLFAGKRHKIGGQEVYFQLGHLQCTTTAMDTAAANGHLTVVKWLHKHRSEGCTTAAMDVDTANGHLLVVQCLHRNRRLHPRNHGYRPCERESGGLHEKSTAGCTTQAMDSAARIRRLDIVEWLHKNRWEGCTTAAMDGAATNGQFGNVKWLHINGPRDALP